MANAGQVSSLIQLTMFGDKVRQFTNLVYGSTLTHGEKMAV